MAEFRPSDNYTKTPNALFTLYTRLPDFKADHAMLYVILSNYYNEVYKYAFPTQHQLALNLNCGENKPRELRNVLEKYGLIRYEKNKDGHNDVYYLYPPITDEAEFYDRFPEAKQYYDERANRLERRNKTSRRKA